MAVSCSCVNSSSITFKVGLSKSEEWPIVSLFYGLELLGSAFFCWLFNFSISFTFWGVSDFLDLWAVALLSVSVSVDDDLVVRLVNEGDLKCTGLDRCSFRWLTLTFCRSFATLETFSSAIHFGLMLQTLNDPVQFHPRSVFCICCFSCTSCPLHVYSLSVSFSGYVFLSSSGTHHVLHSLIVDWSSEKRQPVHYCSVGNLPSSWSSFSGWNGSFGSFPNAILYGVIAIDFETACLTSKRHWTR